MGSYDSLAEARKDRQRRITKGILYILLFAVPIAIVLVSVLTMSLGGLYSSLLMAFIAFNILLFYLSIT